MALVCCLCLVKESERTLYAALELRRWMRKVRRAGHVLSITVSRIVHKIPQASRVLDYTCALECDTSPTLQSHGDSSGGPGAKKQHQRDREL